MLPCTSFLLHERSMEGRSVPFFIDSLHPRDYICFSRHALLASNINWGRTVSLDS